MLHTFAVANYRSLRDIKLALAPLTIITGANGSGKSNLYRALLLLQVALVFDLGLDRLQFVANGRGENGVDGFRSVAT